MDFIQLLAHVGELHGGGTKLHLLRPVPLHPILVNFTAALLPVSLLSDVLGRLLKRESLRHAAWWTLLFAAAVTPLTALAGWLWLRDMEMDYAEMGIHKWLGTALAALLAGLAVWRWRIHRRGSDGPPLAYLLAAAVVTGALVLQGHLGALMSF